MTLSTSRQQFLACESQAPSDIQYGRKGGVFLTTCVCVGFVIFAVVLAAVVGVLVYFITYFKLSQNNGDFWDDSEPFGVTGPPSPDLRLPLDVNPSFYRLKIKADLDKSTFSGDVAITLRANKRVKEIILHSKDLKINSNAKLTEQIYEKVETLHSRRKRESEVNITVTESTVTQSTNGSETSPKTETNLLAVTTSSINVANETLTEAINVTETVHTTKAPVPPNNVTKPIEQSTTTVKPTETIQTQVTHSSVRNIKILSITEGKGDRLIITLASALKPDVDYILELQFEGEIANSLNGFYKSTYVNNASEVKNLGVTQFESTYARQAFPCFDAPAFKAKFEISIAHSKQYTALSNMKISAEEDIQDQPGWKWTHFERSVKMSTYLVAYVLSDFVALETSYLSKDNITKPIKIWTRPELQYKAKYAALITPRILEYYEEVFGLPYALDKLDLIAIPDFSSGAMENWGLITYRETTLLFDDVHGVPRDKLNVAIDIAHELAHQWFGNLVTMAWWTDLWLNEGFATYIEYIGVNHVKPDWNIFETFSRDKMELLRTDSLKNTSPVSRKVVDASEISQKFDEISYAKGANLIRMLNHTISEKLFHEGLVEYLNKWKYSNAIENDLWASMPSVPSSPPIATFMNSWTRQAGYPAVTIVRDYNTGDVSFTQRLFTTSRDPYPKMLEQLWYIPVSYTSLDSPVQEWSTAPQLWLNERSKNVKVNISNQEALYVNVDAIGYYRVNYDPKNWELLKLALKSNKVLSPVTRAQLIDDAFNLAKSSQLDYSLALDLSTFVMNGDDSKLVWELLLNNLVFLKHNLRSTSGYIYFQDYVQKLISKQLERLNFGMNKPKDDNEAFLIENLLSWECNVESKRCLDWAKAEFDKWMQQPDFNDNPIPSFLRSLVYTVALKHGGRREFEFLWNVFQNSTDPNVKSLIIVALPSTREENLVTMLLERSLTVISKQYAVAVWSVEPPVGTSVAQAYLRNHFDIVYKKFTEMDAFMFPLVLNGAYGAISTQAELDDLKSVAAKHKDKLLPMSQTLQKIIDSATLRINWIQKHANTINKWMEEFSTGKLNKSATPTSNITNETEKAKNSENIGNVSNIISHDKENVVVTKSIPKAAETSQNNEVTAKVEEVTSKIENATSKIEDTTSKIENVTSAVEVTTPVVDTTAKIEASTPITETSIPIVEATTQKTDSNLTSPSVTELVPNNATNVSNITELPKNTET